MLNKVGLFTNIDYVDGYISLFTDEGYDCEFEVCTDMLPDWASKLKVWDSKGLDIAIIDEAQFSEKDPMVDGIVSFMNSGRAEGGHLRIVFFSAPERRPDDRIFVTLAHNGVYDFVIPQDKDADVASLLALVRNGRRRDQVITYIAAEEPARERVFYSQKGKQTIAVASFSPRAGVTTTAFTLARTIILAYKRRGLSGKEMPIVGVGVSEEFFNSLAFGYRHKFDPSYGVFRINGMLIFNAMSSREVPRCSYIVLDLGQLDLQKTYGELAGNERYRTFLDADCRVVCVPYTNFIEATAAMRVFSAFDPKIFATYKLAFWGIKDKPFEKMKEGLMQKAKGCYPWQMPVSLWPIDLDEIDPATLAALADVLPRGFAVIDESAGKDEAAPAPEKGKGLRGLFGKKDA